MKRVLCMVLTSAALIACASTEPFGSAGQAQAFDYKYPYGVFIGADAENPGTFDEYQTVVIDAMYYAKAQVTELKGRGHTVYSYLNIGSLEDFRSYFDEYRQYTLGEYENWPGEYWIDVSSPEWRNFVVETLAKRLHEKGIDGFFIDNADVYYIYEEQGVYDGIKEIFKGLSKYGIPIIVNGGDTWVTKSFENGDFGLITGVNQECVFTSIDFEQDILKKQNASDTEYFTKYLEECKSKGLNVYLLEYGGDKDFKETIRSFCDGKGYSYYISESVELDGQ